MTRKISMFNKIISIILLVLSFHLFSTLQAIAECTPVNISNEYSLFTNIKDEEEAKTQTSQTKMIILKKNINSGGFSGSERYTQHLVRIVSSAPIRSYGRGTLTFKKSINTIDILTVICDDSNTNRVAFAVPFLADNNGYVYRGLSFHNGTLKSNKVIEGTHTFTSPLPSIALPINLSNEGNFVALPISK